jgi:hypothetical protein
MSAYAKAATAAAKLEMEIAQACCEWDQGNGSCRCKSLPPNDDSRCKSPIGVARALLAKFEIKPR